MQNAVNYATHLFFMPIPRHGAFQAFVQSSGHSKFCVIDITATLLRSILNGQPACMISDMSLEIVLLVDYQFLPS
jgi:hypothetical protein